MSDHNSQLLRKAGVSDLESALAVIKTMSDEMRSLHSELEHLERQYGFAIVERDEARKMVCRFEADRHPAPLTPQEVAKTVYKWDCFDSHLSSKP